MTPISQLPLWPLMVMVVTYIGYQLALKLPSPGLNALAFQTSAYFIAFVTAALLWWRFPELGHNRMSARDWGVALGFGLVVVAAEYSLVAAYRHGWPVNITSTMVNILVALLLLPIGWLLFRERIDLRALLGVALCCSGLALLALR